MATQAARKPIPTFACKLPTYIQFSRRSKGTKESIEESLDQLAGCLRRLNSELLEITARLTAIENHIGHAAKTDGKLSD